MGHSGACMGGAFSRSGDYRGVKDTASIGFNLSIAPWLSIRGSKKSEDFYEKLSDASTVLILYEQY